MIDYQNDEHKKLNLIKFIKVTQNIIETEGFQKISIRKIASLTGFHNSTIYLYFDDLDELIMLASIMHFQKYSGALEEQSNKHADAYEDFFAIWECFSESAFEYACEFNNFFFGKYSDNLFRFLNVYYDLFPEEQNQYTQDIKAMYFGKNYDERCMKILVPLIDDNRTCVTADNIEIINDITVGYCKYILAKKCSHPELDSNKLQKQMMEMVNFVVSRK